MQATRLGSDNRCPLLATEIFHPVIRQESIAPNAAFSTINCLLPKKANL
jgi:hypothetical protein